MQPNESWASVEFSTISLGDERLNKRFFLTAQRKMERSQSPIRHACRSWKEAKGAYRMFENEQVSAEKIKQAHYVSTASRLKSHKKIFAIQDTSFLDFNSYFKTDGLGSIGKRQNEVFGLVSHTCLAVDELGVPLGLLSSEVWSQEKIDMSLNRRQRGKLKAKLPIEKKSSFKWIKALRAAKRLIPQESFVTFITDRESDIAEYMLETSEMGAGFIIRSSHNRKVNKETENDEYLWDELSKVRPQGLFEVEIKNKQDARKTRLTVRFADFDLCASTRALSARSEIAMKDIPITAILAEEKNPLPGTQPIYWRLLTNLPVTSLADALEIIENYSLRWNIEMFFWILKQGCKVEDCRLQNAKKIEKYFSLMSVIAYRLLYLTQCARTPQGELPCTEILSDVEWKTLYIKVHKVTALPQKPPTIRQVTYWIGKLGGHLGRKSDGFPGPVLMWRGWNILQETTDLWKTIAPLASQSPPMSCG